MLRARINGVQAPRRQQVVTVSNPAAGADWSYTVLTGTLWRLVSVHMNCTADANAANRHIRLFIKRGTPALGCAAAASTFPATATAAAIFELGVVANTVSNTSHISPLPDIGTLKAGDVISTTTENIQAGDQFANIYLTFEVVH